MSPLLVPVGCLSMDIQATTSLSWAVFNLDNLTNLPILPTLPPATPCEVQERAVDDLPSSHSSHSPSILLNPDTYKSTRHTIPYHTIPYQTTIIYGTTPSPNVTSAQGAMK